MGLSIHPRLRAIPTNLIDELASLIQKRSKVETSDEGLELSQLPDNKKLRTMI